MTLPGILQQIFGTKIEGFSQKSISVGFQGDFERSEACGRNPSRVGLWFWKGWFNPTVSFSNKYFNPQIPSVLKDAQSVGMMTAYHNYLITNMVGYNIWYLYGRFGKLYGSFSLYGLLYGI